MNLWRQNWFMFDLMETILYIQGVSAWLTFALSHAQCTFIFSITCTRTCVICKFLAHSHLQTSSLKNQNLLVSYNENMYLSWTEIQKISNPFDKVPIKVWVHFNKLQHTPTPRVHLSQPFCKHFAQCVLHSAAVLCGWVRTHTHTHTNALLIMYDYMEKNNCEW